MSHPPILFEGPELQAALHAFGLEPDPAREVRDPDFAARAVAWRARMAELDATAEPGRVDPSLWSRIEAALDTETETGSDPAAMPAETPVRSGPWRNVVLWRNAALALAAALLVAAGLSVLRPASRPVMVAVLLTDANRAAAIVDVYADGRVDLVPLETITVPDDRILQVWTLWDRARGPVSLGLLDRARQARLPVADLPRTIPDQLFEITLEPRGGSPTGRPTGPILMKGTTSPTL
jgi:anti-sigma-K factor RskA